MSFVSERERRQVMEECFSGHMSRDCPNCPAHPSNGGTCCYGSEKFDDNDKECTDCIHHDDCQQEAINREAEAQWYERSYGRRPPSSAPMTPRRIVRLPIIQPSAEPRRITGSNPSRVPSRFAMQDAQLEKPRALLIKPQTYSSTKVGAIPTKSAPQPEPTKAETLFVRFFKDFIWGGLQGAFEMATDFFRNHRLP